MKFKLIIILWSLILASTGAVRAKEDMKIYISADMEGLVGAVTEQQLGPEGFEYNQFRRIYTNEVNAAIEAAFAAGATEILVSDSHGNGQGLLIEDLNPKVQLVRSWPRPLGMMQGIDASYAGVFFIGFHASTTNMKGVRAHTMSSANLTSIKLNGVPMSEASFNAAVAGHFNVPVLLVTGDDAIAEEATALLGDIETAIVKWAYGFHSVRTLLPDAAYALIRDKSTKALAKIGKISPYKLKGPITLEVSFKNYTPVELLAYLPIIERIDSHTIRYRGKDMIDISKFIEFILSYSAEMKP